MKLKVLLFTAALVVVMMVVVPTSKGLEIGDKAPSLSIAEWVKGAPIDLARDAKKKIHVVEFWAVWCPPCKMSVPLLTRLQKKYAKDVVILGVTEPDTGQNSPAAIRRFVKDQGSNMEYVVAIDTGRTTSTYMAAAGAIGIPHAFVVGRDGKVAWQGSPLDPTFDTVLGQLSAGTFDITAAKVEQQVNKKLDQLNLLAQLGQWRKVWDGLIEILKLDPANEVALDVLMRISVEELRNKEAFREWARSHVGAHSKNASAMTRLATTLCNIGDMTSRCPDLALQAAKAAYDATGQRDALTITVYARALYQIGELDRAIALQQDVVAVALGDNRERVQGIFDYYRLCKKLHGSDG